ncbi:MAG: hypothetical protein GKS05_03170 [Nitrospirales bacterium]|nr:hypothetical protein [Nitrospirales bacterium]
MEVASHRKREVYPFYSSLTVLAHGTVQSANVISDKFTGQSRGFGFIEMSSGEEAQAARTGGGGYGGGGDFGGGTRRSRF